MMFGVREKAMHYTPSTPISRYHTHPCPSSLYAAAESAPYLTCNGGCSPDAMKFVFGLPVSFAAEQRAIVGEL